MNHHHERRVGWIGIGAMGGPMAGHVARQGQLALIGNRTLSRAEALARELGVASASKHEAFVDCEVVALCVGGDQDVLDNVRALARVMQPGSIVVDHSTVSVSTARAAAECLAAAEVGFLDAPVSGGVEGARLGRLSIMVGGSAETLQRAEPVLQCYAARIAHMGPSGAGQATKAVNQAIVAGINEAVCEGLALGERLGLDAEILLPTLQAGAAASWFLDKRGATMLRDAFTPGFKSAHMAKDLRIVQSMAEQAGMRHPMIDLALQDYAELERCGAGDLDTSALIRLKRPG